MTTRTEQINAAILKENKVITEMSNKYNNHHGTILNNDLIVWKKAIARKLELTNRRDKS